MINLVAVFKPVELEGTSVTRASVHNISIMEELKLGDGDTIKVYKANMIIPQISEKRTKTRQVHLYLKFVRHVEKEPKIKNDNGVKLYIVRINNTHKAC